MSLAEAIYQRAVAQGVGGLIGTPPRIYPVDEVPQDVADDYVQFLIVDGPRVHVMSRDSLAQPRVQFECFSATRKAAWAIAEAIKGCYGRQTFSAGGTAVTASVVMDEGHDIEKDEETQRPGVSVDLEFTYGLV